MEAVPQKVLSWLHGVLLNGYRDVNRTYQDVGQVLGHFPTIRPSTDVYTFEDGRPALLLHLSGTIPASFRGTSYAFPVSIWVPYEYPAWPPIGLVTAAQGMSVRPGQHVGVDGKIYHPYLGNWQPDKSNLLGLLHVFAEIFSKEPPLVARQKAPALPALPGTPSRSSSLGYAPHAPSGQPQAPVLPPKPGQQQDGVRGPADAPEAPPRPPKPGEETLRPRTGFQTQGHQRPTSMMSPGPVLLSQTPLSYAGPPPPQRPQSWQQAPQPIQRSPQQYRAAPPKPQQPQSRQGEYRSRHGFTLQPGQHVNHAQGHPYPPQFWQQQPQHPQPIVSKPAQPPEDLLTSPFDVALPTSSSSNFPVPPVPPNPEKDALLHAVAQTLTTQLQSTLTSNTNALHTLQAQQTALQTAFSNLQQEFAHLRALEAQVQANESTLHESLKEAEACIADARQRKVPSIDETLIAPTVLSNQVYKLVAEEMSCVSAREVLGRGLDRGRIGAEGWVKSVRGVAREEWLKKWLTRKAATGMGLQGIQSRGVDEEEKEVLSGVDEAAFYR